MYIYTLCVHINSAMKPGFSVNATVAAVPRAWQLTLVFLSSFPAPSLPLLTMRADKIRNENVRYTHLHGSWKEPNVIRLVSQDSATCFVQLGLVETHRFSSPESVSSLTVSIYTARWGHCWEHPEGAAGWPRVGTCRGDTEETAMGTPWHREGRSRLSQAPFLPLPG